MSTKAKSEKEVQEFALTVLAFMKSANPSIPTDPEFLAKRYNVPPGLAKKALVLLFTRGEIVHMMPPQEFYAKGRHLAHRTPRFWRQGYLLKNP